MKSITPRAEGTSAQDRALQALEDALEANSNPPMRPELRQRNARDIMQAYHAQVTLRCEHILRPSELVRCVDRSCYRPRPWVLLAAFAVLCAAVSYVAP